MTTEQFDDVTCSQRASRQTINLDKISENFVSVRKDTLRKLGVFCERFENFFDL